MTQHGKNYSDALKRIDREELHSIPVAVGLVKELATAKFDETVEFAGRLGIDPRKAEPVSYTHLTLPTKRIV